MGIYDGTAATPATPDFALERRVLDFMRRAYGWMAMGLLLTAFTAATVVSFPALLASIIRTPILFWGLFIAQLGIVFVISGRVHKLAASTASALFVVYSILTGITISFIALIYTGESIASMFLVTAAMFGAMALWGTVTRRDLTGFGQFLFMGLVGVVLASVVNIFLRHDGVAFVTSFIGVIVFTGLAAYDAQRLKVMAVATPEGQAGSYAIVGALALYLDFINLFLMLLRLFGGRRR